MLQRLPERVDPFQLADAEYHWRGELLLGQLSRLSAALSGSEGVAQVSLTFGTDEVGTRFLFGRATASVGLICQRCLEPLELVLDAEFRLGLAQGPQQAEALAERYDPFVVEGERLDLRDLIEDELLLALPLVAMHAREVCPASHILEHETQEADAAVDPDNPFAVLSSLKQKRDE